ncbi:MAG: TlpA family protein disulfide reductase [Pyrinomonadaceae bacterium]|nr:TlpA family protein disulfide reductase [Pyrinomonadaceae bacterium]
MKILANIVLFLFIASFTAVAQTSLMIGSPAPAFSGNGMDGTCNDLSELRGKVVVLTFWSTRCEICRHEFPKVNQMVKNYENRNVVFLALTMENEAKVEAYLQKNQLAPTILPNSFGVVLQYADRTADDRVDMGFPSFFVIDKAGTIQYRSSGFNRTASLNAAIERLASK